MVITTMPEDIMDKLVLPQLQTWNKDNQKMIPAYGWKSSLNCKPHRKLVGPLLFL